MVAPDTTGAPVGGVGVGGGVVLELDGVGRGRRFNTPMGRAVDVGVEAAGAVDEAAWLPLDCGFVGLVPLPARNEKLQATSVDALRKRAGKMTDVRIMPLLRSTTTHRIRSTDCSSGSSGRPRTVRDITSTVSRSPRFSTGRAHGRAASCPGCRPWWHGRPSPRFALTGGPASGSRRLARSPLCRGPPMLL